MTEPSAEPTRPRVYDFPPAEGIPHRVAAHLVAALDELSARHFHMISRLPADVLAWRPAPSWPCISQTAAHMVHAEALWVSACAQAEIPQDLAEPLDAWRSGDPAAPADLQAACDRVRDRITRPVLAARTEIDALVTAHGRQISLRGVLMHLVWHWTYHNGQAGLIAGQCGHEYGWTFATPLAGWQSGGEA